MIRTDMRRVLFTLLLGVAVTGAAYTQSAPPPRTIDVTAKKFEFEPRRIEVKVGEPVTLNLTSIDAEHGFECKGLRVKAVTYNEGLPTQVTFTAEKAGTYEFKCSHRCGAGHLAMKGQIVVVP
jgi:cytochrome c oxidase subunit 2